MKRTKLSERILASGEVTGHAHRVTVDVYETENGLREFDGGTTVTHEEHKTIEIPEGEWVSGRVLEFDHIENQMRKVSD